MKATGGKANPALVNRLLEDKLSKIVKPAAIIGSARHD